MRTNKNNLSEEQKRVSDLQNLLSKFAITAPSSGMIIYKRDRMGTKRKIGSSINPWDNVVATLPDMSSMISKTYVNEIDVSKVKSGQKVEIMVDAFPERKYSGVVTSVANIGEQLPNADAKVFEVLIKVDGSDPILRPSMTTGNKIITKTISDVIYVPLECVQAGPDSIPFVYLKNGNKQIVVLGESNENNVVIEHGLKEGSQIYLSTPENPENYKLVGEELETVIRDRAKAKKEEEQRLRHEAETNKEQREGIVNVSPERMRQFQRMNGNQPGQGRPRDTSAMRRMRNTANSQPGAVRDTSARRTPNSSQGQKTPR